MRKKRGNMNVVLLVSLVVLLSGAAIISMAVSSKFNSKAAYERIDNRYIAESGIDLAVGLFQSYITNQQFILTYTKNGDGSYSVVDELSPYLLDDIRLSDNKESVPVELVESESNNYLSSIGYLDFKRENGVELYVNIFSNKDNFKLSRMCIEPDFLISRHTEDSNLFTVKSKINPVYLTVKSKYKGGEVLCNVVVENLYVTRQPFHSIQTPGDLANVDVRIDTSQAAVKYENYQNYKTR